MGKPREDRLQVAQAEMSRIHNVLLELEARRDAAMQRIDQIDDEPFETSAEEAETSGRVQAADEEVGQLDQEIADAEDAFRRAQAAVDDCLAVDDASEGDVESLSVWDAAEIWISHGKDEDYMFGYSAEELGRAAKQ